MTDTRQRPQDVHEDENCFEDVQEFSLPRAVDSGDVERVVEVLLHLEELAEEEGIEHFSASVAVRESGANPVFAAQVMLAWSRVH